MSKKEVARNYRFLLKTLKPNVPQTKTSDYISRIVNNLTLSGETERLAVSILSQASDQRLTGGRGPNGIAAACVYIGSSLTGEHRSQLEIAKKSQVTEVTIRTRYKELTKLLNIQVML
jgi:transcription initiation factor TFIIB